ncbi:hypothetical protein TCAL_17387 [Tigriopus californicus]|uniref:Uncharacterized protein n=1 Tax=Tigriopus californicus TaxID=6832 RepID=A0A553PK26_TIGCA|nr:hypothetical protein TCAL_17387 [Tigriopus californicus]
MAGCLTNCSDGDQFLNYNFDDLYNSLLGFTKIVIGESMESTIHEFKYANDNQNFSNFFAYYLPKTGVCFHFNFKGLVKEAGVGQENGMALLIRLNSDPKLREGIQEGKHGLTLTIQRPLSFPTLTACTTTSTVADPESTCGCILSCTEVTFDILHSQGKWPADGSWKQIAKRFGITRPIVMATDMINFEEVDIEKYTDFLWRRKVDTSVMKINIFIRSKESLEFSEKDKYESYWEFLAKMGGSMSVFMGLSFVAVIEVWGTYLVWIWSVVSCKMCRKKKTKELFN